MNRRDFILSGTTAMFCSSVPIFACFSDFSKKSPKLRLSAQIRMIPGDNEHEKLQKMYEWGFDGFEITSLEKDYPEYEKYAKSSSLKISAICYGSGKGAICSENRSTRKNGVRKLKNALEIAGELGAEGVVFFPVFRGQTALSRSDVEKVLLDTLPELGCFAELAGTRLILSPGSENETFMLNTIPETLELARLCNGSESGGIVISANTYRTFCSETDIETEFRAAGRFLRHLHLADGLDRSLPGTHSEHSFHGCFRALKSIAYDSFCTLECGINGDPEIDIPKSIKYLRKCFHEA